MKAADFQAVRAVCSGCQGAEVPAPRSAAIGPVPMAFMRLTPRVSLTRRGAVSLPPVTRIWRSDAALGAVLAAHSCRDIRRCIHENPNKVDLLDEAISRGRLDRRSGPRGDDRADRRAWVRHQSVELPPDAAMPRRSSRFYNKTVIV